MIPGIAAIPWFQETDSWSSSRWLDEFGEYYSRVVVILSLGVALLGPLLFKWPFFGNSGNPLMSHCFIGPVIYLYKTYEII